MAFPSKSLYQFTSNDHLPYHFTLTSVVETPSLNDDDDNYQHDVLSEIQGFHGGENSSRGLMGVDGE